MNFAERQGLVERLSYEARLAYIALCVERCLVEARLHDIPRAQLEGLPLLTRGVDMLWARACDGVAPDTPDVVTILEHLSTYESPAPGGEHALFHYDLTLVHAARMLTKGLRILQGTEPTARYVAGADAGAVMSVGLIYRDAERARAHELAVLETALARLAAWGRRPLSRDMFDDVAEWPRGEVRSQYAEGRILGTAPEWEE